MHGFTKSLAQEVASKGVTVNTVSPGYIMTAMVAAIGDEILEKIASTIPVGRLGNQTKLPMQSLSLPQNVLPSSQDQTLQSTVVSICSRANA